MSWRQFLKSYPEVLRVERILSPQCIPLPTLKTLKTSEVENEKIPVELIPQSQHDFCKTHAMFNNCSGQCPHSIDDCLVSKVIDSDGNIAKLRGFEIGHGITTDMVIDEWLETGEPAVAIFNNPAWLICMAEYIFKG